jgi:hypothetical protein
METAGPPWASSLSCARCSAADSCEAPLTDSAATLCHPI